MNSYPIISTVRVADGGRVKIEYYDKLNSTAELAKKYAAEGYPDRYIIVADAQASSKLTGTRLSEGEFERGVFISCLLRPSMFASQAGLIGHLAAVGLLTALDEHTTKPLGLGWVTDIYCDGERIGGCSIEGKLDSYSTYEYMIVNFGVKLNKKSFPPRLTDMVRRVFEEDNSSIEMIIAKGVINKFFLCYSSIRSPGKYMDIYSRRFILRGVTVPFLSGDKKRRGRIVDVDKDNGSLIIERGSDERIIIRSPSSVVMPKRIK
ncbi:MAG: hypothetical protein IJE25_06265 [Clostridia bacterium]|nr:hypothetical protein [Clostridia bacterium]